MTYAYRSLLRLMRGSSRDYVNNMPILEKGLREVMQVKEEWRARSKKKVIDPKVSIRPALNQVYSSR